MTKKYRVLVVDDYPGARYRRMRILLDGGYEVAEESLGRSAVERLPGGRFDLLVVDIHLPDISGFEVCRRVKADPRTSAMPVLAVSAVSDNEEAERNAAAAGASAYLPDESDDEVFLAAVQRLVAPAA